VEVSTPTDYRKGKTKLLKLPSGHVFEIRKLTLPAMMDLMKVLNIDVPAGTPVDQVEGLMKERMEKAQFKEDVIAAVDLIIPKCVIRPKIVPSQVAGENELSIAEIDPADSLELFQSIIEFSGLEEMTKKFRGQPSGEGDRQPSTELARPTV